MPNYSKNDVILVKYPFSDVSAQKVRPAVVVNAPHVSNDLLVVALTSKTTSLLKGEFVLTDWALAGLNVITAVKRGIYTVHQSLIIKRLGKLSHADSQKIERSLKEWLGMS
ncbi:type II toxin-antitoxin system PemK/MazF family toxin [Deltaproteobacteria bacterium TL4]